MMRLIDLEKFEDTILHDTSWWDDADEDVVMLALDVQENVDAEPVVRCKDCAFYMHDKICMHWSGQNCSGLITEPNDYCSYGERKGRR